MLNIRPAISDDWPLWRALDGHISQELFLRKAGAGECYIALEDNSLAGLLRWNLFWDGVPFCTLLLVEERCRGKGIGRALVNRWEEDMAVRGHGMAMTSTQADETAQHFWRKLNYRDAGGFVVDVPGYAQPLELIFLKDLRGQGGKAVKRIAFLFRALAGQRQAARDALKAQAADIAREAAANGIDNFSVWGVEDMICGYGECGDETAFRLPGALTEALEGRAELLCAPGTMRLMYHDIGIVREDKSLIRHRVFVTKLKPGCEAEYKRRHDGLIEARGDTVSEGPDSNFTIWNGAGYIFGYCEKVKSFDREMTPEERESTIAWETRQLEIMDWLTDDVDWITGESHEPIQRLA